MAETPPSAQDATPATTATAEASLGPESTDAHETEDVSSGGDNLPALRFSGPIEINAGETGNLALTVPAAVLSVDLSSNNTAIATVPATATSAAGATSVTVPVTGVGAGLAIITAGAADTASATAAVTVNASTRFYNLNLSPYGEDVERVARAMLWSLLLGLLLAGVGAWQRWVFALLWSGACSAVGWALGFLFGIPRTLSGQPDQPITQRATATQPSPDSGTPGKATVTAASHPGSVNTNLEQVSDWLTKILVGVSLVELTKVKDALGSAATAIADSLGGSYWMSFSLALMIYFSVTGFLGSYLLTRLFLQRLLTNSE